MPGAISGNEDEKGYTFIITSTPKDIKTYYVEKFQELGYMCVLNMFKEDDKFSGLMCFSPTLTLLAETQGDGNVKVTISFFTP